MVVEHPFHLATPLPVAGLITNEHSIDAVRPLSRKLHSLANSAFVKDTFTINQAILLH